MSGQSTPDLLFLLAEMGTVIREVSRNDGWMVVICPTMAVTEECSLLGAVMAPSGVVSGGRTLLFPNNGRLSVTKAEDETFIPDGMPFSVAFLGWSAKDDGKEMTKWANKANKIFRG